MQPEYEDTNVYQRAAVLIANHLEGTMFRNTDLGLLTEWGKGILNALRDDGIRVFDPQDTED